jgi:hypothetical protein
MLNAINEIQHALPFELRGLDSDNGSEFINYHLKAFCDHEHIQFTRSRPYKKNDNAHVEQKNWTHVRKLFGYVRYDSKKALDAMNELYQNELRLLQNLFLPSVKLVHKERVGSKLKRIYDYPQTPLERLGACSQADPHKVAELKKLRESVNPFKLSKTIDQKLERIFQMGNPLRSPTESSTPRTSSLTHPSQPLSPIERDTMKTLSEIFGIPAHVKSTKPHRNT